MTDDNNNIQTEPEESVELKPVKNHFKKIISVGATIVAGGIVVVLAAPLLPVGRTAGATRSARLNYEQQKSEARALANEQAQAYTQKAANEQAEEE